MSQGTCKIDSQGRIVTPSTWRTEQGIRPGQELVILEEDGRLIVQTREQAIAEAQAIVRRAARPGSLAETLLAERRRERARENAPGQTRGRRS